MQSTTRSSRPGESNGKDYYFLDNEGFQKSVISYPDLTNEEMELFVDRALREYYPSIFYLPIALRAILKRNGLLELKRIIISAKRKT